MSKTDIHKKAFLAALEKSLGVVSVASRASSIDRQRHYEWMQKDEAYKKAVEELSELVLDFAESQLHKQIQEGEVAATIFYLKTKGKRRGYIEKTEIDHTIQGIKQLIIEPASKT